jgi:hypothetical protein
MFTAAQLEEQHASSFPGRIDMEATGLVLRLAPVVDADRARLGAGLQEIRPSTIPQTSLQPRCAIAAHGRKREPPFSLFFQKAKSLISGLRTGML